MVARKDVWVVIPTYNERANVGPLVADIRKSLGPQGQILIVDDASPDGTAAVARAIPEVRVLERTGPRGYGFSMCAGMELALESGAGAVITMDADLSHDASILPQLLAGLADADVTVGSRYCGSHASVENWSRHRYYTSQLATALVRSCTGVSLAQLPQFKD